MKRWFAIGFAVGFLFVLTACSPEGDPCDSEGSIKATSKYGVFYCRKTDSGLRWEE